MDLYDRTQGSSPTDDNAAGLPNSAANTRPLRRHKVAIVSGALAVAAVVGFGAVFGIAQNSTIAGTAVAATPQVNTDAAAGQPVQPGGGYGLSPWSGSDSQSGSGGSGTGDSSSGGQLGSGQLGGGQLGGGQLGSGQLGGGQLGGGRSGLGGMSTSALGTASSEQEVGVVDIDTVLGYQGAMAAGTGMVLTANGEILTNNHVIEGSTSITVTIVSSGQQYSATVVGTDATDDIAVLQLSGASNLDTANFADASQLAVGDAVTGVGNAGGDGGTSSASPGNVTALNQTITTQAESGAAAETLHGLIQTNADIQAGDSGGPLYNAKNEVVGIDTAASAGGMTSSGYAIPIASALSIAQQIQNGQASENIVIGLPAFLGVQVSSTSNSPYRYSQVPAEGALISGVVSGAPAAEAGLTAGDTITAIDGTTIVDAAGLTAALTGHSPGENVTITWVGTSGASESASVTLASGPAL